MYRENLLKVLFFALLFGTAAAVAARSGVTIGSAQETAPSAKSATDAQQPEIQPAGSPPKAVFAETTFDFGTVGQGTGVEHSFTVTNQGGSNLLIQGVQPACGCTGGAVDSNTVLPGASAAIKAKFDTTGFQGQKIKTLRVFTNDPVQPFITLAFKGYVSRDVELDPPRAYFGDVKRGSIKPVTVAVKTTSSGIQINEVTAKSEYLELQTQPAGDGMRVTVGLRANTPLGLFRDRVLIRTTSAQTPVINLPIFAHVEGDLKLEPADVSLGLLQGPLAAPLQRQVKLTDSGSARVNVTDVSSDNSSIKAKAEKAGSGQYLINLTIAEGTSGTIRSRIKITTDHPDPDQRELTLPVYGIISRKGD